MDSAQSEGIEANPEALGAIVKAGETLSIVASEDIVDIRGVKLWSKGQPVSAQLQQRLLERKLRHPMEACLMAENGVTSASLHDDLQVFLNSKEPLALALQPWAATLLRQVKALPLHAVAQLLLSTAMATRPDTLPHSIQTMALAGAMASRDGSVLDIRLAMLGGLLHDIGEVYIQPQYLDASGPVNLVGYKHIAAHPRAAQVLLSSTTDYPTSLCRAIGEHHERLDGSGYPARLEGEKFSSLGRLLAVTEVTVGIMRAPKAPFRRASFALRVIPGKFDTKWAGLVCDAAREAKELIPVSSNKNTQDTSPLEEIEGHSARARLLEASIKEKNTSPLCAEVIGLALKRLQRLRIAWNGLGLWGIDAQELEPEELFEMQMARQELGQNLRELQRECLLMSERLNESEKLLVAPLWQNLLDKKSP